MYDHLLTFADEQAARDALPGFVTQGKDGEWHWDTSRVIIGVRMITEDAQWDLSGKEPVEIAPEQVLPGFWVAIGSSGGLLSHVRDLPDNACRLVLDRDKAKTETDREKINVYVSRAVDQDVISKARMSPVFSGSTYELSDSKVAEGKQEQPDVTTSALR